MATHILLVRFTPQGVRTIRDSPKRAAAFAKTAKGLGVTVESTYWTSGGFDGVLILDAPDDETASALALTLARAGNVQTHTLRAFDGTQMKSVLARVR